MTFQLQGLIKMVSPSAFSNTDESIEQGDPILNHVYVPPLDAAHYGRLILQGVNKSEITHAFSILLPHVCLPTFLQRLVGFSCNRKGVTMVIKILLENFDAKELLIVMTDIVKEATIPKSSNEPARLKIAKSGCLFLLIGIVGCLEKAKGGSGTGELLALLLGSFDRSDIESFIGLFKFVPRVKMRITRVHQLFLIGRIGCAR
jgi:hypothetical protein